MPPYLQILQKSGLPSDTKDTERMIIQIHGSTRDPNSIVLTRERYRDLLHTKPVYANFLKSLMSSHTVLYLGFSFTDDYLNEVRSEVMAMKANVQHPLGYAIIDSKSEAQRKYYRSHEGIEFLTWDPQRHGYGVFDRYLSCIMRRTNLAAALSDTKVILWEEALLHIEEGQRCWLVLDDVIVREFLPPLPSILQRPPEELYGFEVKVDSLEEDLVVAAFQQPTVPVKEGITLLATGDVDLAIHIKEESRLLTGLHAIAEGDTVHLQPFVVPCSQLQPLEGGKRSDLQLHRGQLVRVLPHSVPLSTPRDARQMLSEKNIEELAGLALRIVDPHVYLCSRPGSDGTQHPQFFVPSVLLAPLPPKPIKSTPDSLQPSPSEGERRSEDPVDGHRSGFFENLYRLLSAEQKNKAIFDDFNGKPFKRFDLAECVSLEHVLLELRRSHALRHYIVVDASGVKRASGIPSGHLKLFRGVYGGSMLFDHVFPPRVIVFVGGMRDVQEMYQEALVREGNSNKFTDFAMRKADVVGWMQAHSIQNTMTNTISIFNAALSTNPQALDREDEIVVTVHVSAQIWNAQCPALLVQVEGYCRFCYNNEDGKERLVKVDDDSKCRVLQQETLSRMPDICSPRMSPKAQGQGQGLLRLRAFRAAKTGCVLNSSVSVKLDVTEAAPLKLELQDVFFRRVQVLLRLDDKCLVVVKPNDSPDITLTFALRGTAPVHLSVLRMRKPIKRV